MQEIWSGKEQKGVLILADEGGGRLESVSIWKRAANTYRDKMPGKGQSWFAGRFNFVCMRNIDKYQGWGLPCRLSDKQSTCQCRRHGFHP